ncbi:MAG: hypothetical protein IBJ11_00515 [Phycisphaerales bacterium]|nr:hypothetical protein [Phycisphaerales bacterium]
MADGPQPSDRPEPRRPPPQPEGVAVRKLVMSADPFPIDSDGNGFADTFNVSVYLFAEEREYPLPLYKDGAFEFVLTDERGQVIAEWTIDKDRADRSRVQTLPGPGYVFTLNLLDVADDKLSTRRGSLSCEFVPFPSGPTVRSRGQTTLMLGRTGGR